MTDEQIFEIAEKAWQSNRGSEREFTIDFARALLAAGASDRYMEGRNDGWNTAMKFAAGASEGQADLWARADYPVLWTRHGSGENAWYSRDGYEARKNAAGRWVLSRAGLPIFEHEYLQEVTARAFVLTHDPSAEIAALRERIAGMEKDAAWISVDERLPTNDQIVAFVVKADRESTNWYLNGHVLGGTYHENWGFSTPGVGHRASHWMPLPEAPASSVVSKEEGV
jgi:hypothetical protein